MSRLDQTLVEKGLCPSREKAQRAVLAGTVRVNQRLAQKPSETVKATDEITLDLPERYVSRGGKKLEHALQFFEIDVSELDTVDVGASTGGFTDCLLQHGAAKVFAVDVGQGQLAWKLRQDPRVIVMEKFNARQLAPEKFPQPFSPLALAVIDCSFISLQRIIPSVATLLRKQGRIVALVKPQFEAGKAEADKGAGVIRDPAIHARVLKELEDFVRNRGDLLWRGSTESPLLGPAGNKEFFVLLEKN